MEKVSDYLMIALISTNFLTLILSIRLVPSYYYQSLIVTGARTTRTIIVVGETRSGKSSLCNVLKGDKHSSLIFPVSFGMKSVTHKTSIVPAYFRGNLNRPITIIDTKGIVDPNCSETKMKERNKEVQSEILSKLSEIDGVNLFVICWNGANPRLTASLVEMLKILQDMFGYKSEGGISIPDPQEFWRRCVISYSRISWDESSIRIRKRQMESEGVEYDMRDTIAIHFGPESRGIECVYIDALYDAKDTTQALKFDEGKRQRVRQVIPNFTR